MKIRILAALAAACAIALPAQAATKILTVNGQFTQVNFPNSQTVGPPTVGQTFSLSLTYDTADLGNTSNGTVNGAIDEAKITFGNVEYIFGSTRPELSGSTVLFGTDPNNGRQFIDVQVGIRGGILTPSGTPFPNNVFPDYVGLRLFQQGNAYNVTGPKLFDGTGNIFTTDGQPIYSASTISVNVNYAGTVLGGNGSINGVSVAPAPIAGGVPEPSAWLLFILGFGSVGAAMRSRMKRGVSAFAQ